MKLPQVFTERRWLRWVLVGATLLGCIGAALAIWRPVDTRRKLFDGQVVKAYFPLDWTVHKGPPYLLEDYAAPEDPLRGSIILGDLYELPETNEVKELNKVHNQFVRSGIAKSDIHEQTFDGVRYISFAFKPHVRPYETYTKGYLTFPSGHSVRITTIKKDADSSIGQTIDSIVASIREKR